MRTTWKQSAPVTAARGSDRLGLHMPRILAGARLIEVKNELRSTSSEQADA